MKDQPLHFDGLDETEVQTLSELQSKVFSSSFLALLRLTRKHSLDTDVCNKQMGWVLIQKQPDGYAKQVRCWYRSLNKAEKAYDTTHCECLAVVWAVLLLRTYLEQSRFTLCTEPDALRWILNVTDATGKLARCRLRFQKSNWTS